MRCESAHETHRLRQNRRTFRENAPSGQKNAVASNYDCLNRSTRHFHGILPWVGGVRIRTWTRLLRFSDSAYSKPFICRPNFARYCHRAAQLSTTDEHGGTRIAQCKSLRNISKAMSAGHTGRWRNITITLKMPRAGILSVTAFHEKAGRSQVDSLCFL